MTPTTHLGRIQRQVILCLMDGEERSASRIDMDMLMDPGTAYGALRVLWRRGIVDRAFSHDEIEWHLTVTGAGVADAIFPEGSDDEEAPL